MTEEKLIEILKKDYPRFSKKRCRIFLGLKIITKYLPEEGIDGAYHDMICSVLVTDLVKAGITKEDAEKLGLLGWMVENGEYLIHYA